MKEWDHHPETSRDDGTSEEFSTALASIQDMTELHAMLQAVEGCPDPFSRAVRYQLMLRNALSSLGAVQARRVFGNCLSRLIWLIYADLLMGRCVRGMCEIEQ